MKDFNFVSFIMLLTPVIMAFFLLFYVFAA